MFTTPTSPSARSPSRGRRQFLLATAALATAHLDLPSAIAAGTAVMLERQRQDLMRVRIEMDVEGNVNVAENPLVSRKSAQKLPIKSDAVFDYEERYRHLENQGVSAVTTVERYYHEARSESRVNRALQHSDLRDSVRTTIVRRDNLPEVIYAVDDYFHRDELELLRVPASSVATDQLIPTQSVTEGSTYEIAADALRSVLNLTSIEASDVTAEVVSIGEKNAKIQFRGKVDGSVEGVPTVIRTIGKLTFDRILGTCTWLAMAVHETREIGIAEPGFDVAATIKMVRRPLEKTIALPPRPPEINLLASVPADRLYIDLTSEQLGVGVLMNRHWRLMSDLPGAAMMRMVEDDRSIAQCDFRSLPSLEPGTQWTLEAFQADIRRTLGEQLTELIEADQRLGESGLRVLRVVAQGVVQGVPIQWIVLHFSDDSGRRVLATFTMEGDRAETFAGADVQLASTLRFIPPVGVDAAESTSAGLNDPSNTRVSEAISRQNEDDKVQSASDLR